MQAHIIRSCRERLRSKKGATLVSLIVGFVVLLLALAMLLGVLQLAQRATVRAEQFRKSTNELLKDYYVNSSELPPTVVGQPKQSFSLSDGETAFSIELTQYAYTRDGESLYAFGPHRLPQ